jgi:hypothetical protein
MAGIPAEPAGAVTIMVIVPAATVFPESDAVIV